MSTLVAQTISNGTVSTSSANVIQGSAKAWVRFNGQTSPGTIAGSFNVSSVSKIGTGQYTINFTNALTDTNYAASGSGRDAQGPVMTVGTFNTTSLTVTFIVPNVVIQDCSTASVIVHR